MKIIKRQLIRPKHSSRKSLETLLKEKRLTNKLISTYDVSDDLRKKLKYQRTRKNPLIYPKVMSYSQMDKYCKYPFYLYFIEDIKRFEEYLLNNDKRSK